MFVVSFGTKQILCHGMCNILDPSSSGCSEWMGCISSTLRFLFFAGSGVFPGLQVLHWGESVYILISTALSVTLQVMVCKTLLSLSV